MRDFIEKLKDTTTNIGTMLLVCGVVAVATLITAFIAEWILGTSLAFYAAIAVGIWVEYHVVTDIF